MTEKIIIAGAGGQGIMLLGKVLAESAMREDKYVTWLPSYGAEVRGGTAHCMVIISDKEISSPYIEKPDSLIIMNAPSLEKFKNRLTPKGLLILNSSLVPGPSFIVAHKKDVKVFKHPFTDIAIKLGNLRVANMVALGCYLNKEKIINPQTVFRVMEEIAPEDKRNLIEINKQALSTGLGLIK